MKKLVFLFVFFLLSLIYLSFVKSTRLEERQETEIKYRMLPPTHQEETREPIFLYKNFGSEGKIYSTVKIGNQTYTYDEKLANDLQEAGIEFNLQDLVDYSDANEIPIMVKYESPVVFGPKVGVSTEGKTTVKDVSSFSDNINTISSIKSVTNTNEGKFKYSFKNIPYTSLKIPRDRIKDFKSSLYSSLGNKLEKISVSSKYHVLLMDSIPLINADDVWKLQDSQRRNITGKNITIAIIDTGIDYTRPDFGNCTPPANPCTGNVNLTLSPNPVNTSSNVHANVKGVYNCSFDLTSVVRKDSCNGEIACMYGGCGKVSDGQIICDCYFTSSDAPGNYNYYGCVDKNKDGYYNDPGEFDLEILNVTSSSIKGVVSTEKKDIELLNSPSTDCKIIGGYNFVDENDDPSDDYGHGTHCAGIAAGNGTLKGVAPDAKLIAYKVCDSVGSCWEDDIIAAIERAQDPNQDGDYSDHVDVISMSLGGPGDPDDPMSQTVDKAVENGVIVVVSAGNSGPMYNTIGSPGTARKVITVGASDKNDVIAIFSSRGPTSIGTIKPDFLAPGVNICSAQYDSAWNDRKCFDDKHVAISGTSMATPHVAGATALIKQAHLNWTPDEIKYALRSTAIDLGYDVNTQGYGRIDVLKAVQLTNAPPVAWLNTSGVVEGIINIMGYINNKIFKNYTLYYGQGYNPSSWIKITSSTTLPSENLLFSNWDTTLIDDGEYLLRLVVFNNYDQVSEDRAVIIVENINATIIHPLKYLNLFGKENITIKGSVSGPNFKNYTVYYAPITNLNNWLLINSSTIPVVDGILANWDTDMIDNGEYMINLTVNTLNFKKEDYVNVTIDKTIMKGWPQTIDYTQSEPVVADINGDGLKEIIILTTYTPPWWGPWISKLYIFNSDGTSFNESAWPKEIGHNAFASPAIADLDNDGDLEIVAANSITIFAFNPNGSILPGWPITKNDQMFFYPPTISDIDQDGKPEIIIGSSGCIPHPCHEYMYAFKFDGTNVSGWPIQFPTIDHGGIVGTPATGDVDNDGDLEIAACSEDGLCHLWHHNGTNVIGWPQNASGTYGMGNVVLGDINGDGNLEVISYSMYGSVFIWYNNGTVYPNWPISAEFPFDGVSVADVDNDGDLEIGAISIYTNPSIWLWYHNGTNVTGWPQRFGSWGAKSEICFANMDNNEKKEIISGIVQNSQYLLYAWHSNATVLNDFPKHLDFSPTTPVISDVNDDGKVELIVSGTRRGFNGKDVDLGRVVVFETNITYNTQGIEWEQFHHDEKHTGLYTKPPEIKYPQLYNLGHEPSIVTDSASVNIVVQWVDNVSLKTVIISENSTGLWEDHICNLSTGQCSGEIRLISIGLSVVIVVIACLLILTFISKTGVIKIGNTLLVFLGLILGIILFSIFMFPEISHNLTRTLMRMGIIPMAAPPQTFTHTIPKENLMIGKVVGYKSYTNDTDGNEAETVTKTFIVQTAVTTTTTTVTTIPTTTTTILTTTTTIPVKPDLTLSPSDIVFSNTSPSQGESITINATIQNIGSSASNVTVQFFNDWPQWGNQIGDNQTIDFIDARENKTVSVFWTPQWFDYYNIYVVIDPSNTIPELNEQNNIASTYLYVGPNAPDVTGYLNINYEQNFFVNETNNVSIEIRNEGIKNATNVTVSLYDLYSYTSLFMFENETTAFNLEGVTYHITINKVDTVNNKVEFIISYENDSKTFNLYQDGIGNIVNDNFVIVDSIYRNSVYLHFGKGTEIETKQLRDLAPDEILYQNFSWTPSTIYGHVLQLTVDCTDDLNPWNNEDAEYVKVIIDAPDVTGYLYTNQLILVNQTVDVDVTVRNEGGRNATNVTAVLYDYLPNNTRVEIWNKTISNLSPVYGWPNYIWEAIQWTSYITGSHTLGLEVNCDNDWDFSNNYYNLTVSVYEPMNITFYLTDHSGGFTNTTLYLPSIVQEPIFINVSKNLTLPKTEKLDIWFVRFVGKDVEALMLWNSTMNETMKSIFEHHPGKIYSDDLILHSIVAYNTSWNYDKMTMAFPIIDYNLYDTNKTSIYACSAWDWESAKCFSSWKYTNAIHEWQGYYYDEYLFSNTTSTNTIALAEPQFCGDDYCSPSESCSSCPQDCGNCPSEYRGGGGGGSGGGVPLEKKKSQTWMKITPGKPEIMYIDDPDIGLKMINITVKNPAQFVTITVTKLTGKPASVVHNISGNVYKYIEITPTNLPDENVDKAKIQFQVNKSWISSNKIDRATIALNRYKNNNWEKLTTREISEDNDYVYYEAESPGFSTFAVTGEEKVITSTIATTTTSLPTKITTTTISEKQITENRNQFIIIFISVTLILAVISISITIFIMKKREKKIPEEFSTTPSLILTFPSQYIGKRVTISGNTEFIKKVEKTGNHWYILKDKTDQVYVVSKNAIQSGPAKIIGIIEESKGYVFIRVEKVEV